MGAGYVERKPMIEFRFDSIAALIAMDGHGFYVWFCVLLALIVVAGNVIILRRSRLRFLREAKGRLARLQAKASAGSALTVQPSSIGTGGSSAPVTDHPSGNTTSGN